MSDPGADQFSTIKGKPQYPSDYVYRGLTQEKTTTGILLYHEYIWGFICLIRDPKTSATDRPALVQHLLDLVEDTKATCGPRYVSGQRTY